MLALSLEGFRPRPARLTARSVDLRHSPLSAGHSHSFHHGLRPTFLIRVRNSFISCDLRFLCFHTLTHYFAAKKIPTPSFSVVSALFVQNTRVAPTQTKSLLALCAEPQNHAPESSFPSTLTSPSQIAENASTLSLAFATLTDRVKHKSFACHSYKKHGGWGYLRAGATRGGCGRIARATAGRGTINMSEGFGRRGRRAARPDVCWCLAKQKGEGL